MPFESVYRVSTRNAVPAEADVDLLSQQLAMELPLGYREYVTTFGQGTMSGDLVVKLPDEIRNPEARNKAYEQELLSCAAEWVGESGFKDLTPEDVGQAVIFAYSQGNAPVWFATRRQGTRLFECVEGDFFEIDGGIFGLIRQLYVRSGVGREGFVDAMARRFGRDGLRCSTSSREELYPRYFVAAIEGNIELHLDPRYNRLPGDSFFVRARYDIDSEQEFAAFVEPLLLPGGGPHESLGDEK